MSRRGRLFGFHSLKRDLSVRLIDIVQTHKHGDGVPSAEVPIVRCLAVSQNESYNLLPGSEGEGATVDTGAKTILVAQEVVVLAEIAVIRYVGVY